MGLLGTMLRRLMHFKEVIGTIVFYVTFASSPFTPDLDVRWSIGPMLVNAPKSEVPAKAVAGGDTDLLSITLTNRSKEPIAVQDLRAHGLRNILKTGARSSAAYLNNDAGVLAESKLVEANTYSFSGVREIPAGHNIQIQVAGSIYRLLLLQERITVISSAKRVSIEEVGEASGITLFIDRNLSTITAVFIAVLILLGAKRILRDEERAKDQ